MADINPFLSREKTEPTLGAQRETKQVNPFLTREGDTSGLPTLNIEDISGDTPVAEASEEEVIETKLEPVGTTDFDDAARFIRDSDGFEGIADLQFELLFTADPDARVNEKYLDENIERLLPPEVPAEALADVSEPTPEPVSEPPVTDDLEATEPEVTLSFDDRLTTLLDAEYDRIEEDEKFQQVIEAEAK